MRKNVLAVVAALLLPGAAPPHQQALPLNVGGRAIADAAGGLTFGWPGVYFEGRFRGTEVRVRFEAPAEHMRLLVDGDERLLFKRTAQMDTSLAGLPQGEHVVRLEKLTESQTGGGRFLGFFTNGEALPAPPRTRQIEFIGDSYTVGYGNRSPAHECSERDVHDLTDTQAAFGPRVARHYGADYRINAYSGFGIVRNYAGGVPSLSLPLIYQRLKPDDPEHLGNRDPSWHPQLIVINLGTNDFSTPVKAGERWTDEAALKDDYRRTYAAFVRRLHDAQPQARFVLMGSDAFYPEVERVAASLDRSLKAQVTTLRFSGLDLAGCDWHPSLADHRRLADLLGEAIERLPGLWPAPPPSR